MMDWPRDGWQLDDVTLAEMLIAGDGVIVELGDTQVRLTAERVGTRHSLPGETVVLTLRQVGAGTRGSAVHLVDFTRVDLDHTGCGPLCERLDDAEAALQRIALGVAASRLLRRAQTQLQRRIAV